MAVNIMIPEKKNETSMGRRLFAMAAPMAGMALGGPAGAAAGAMLGNRIAGGSVSDSVMGGMQAGAGAMSGAKGVKNPVDNSMLQESQKLQNPADQFGRRMGMLSQDPQAVIQEGINAASFLPNDLRKDALKPLIQAQMMGRKTYG